MRFVTSRNSGMPSGAVRARSSAWRIGAAVAAVLCVAAALAVWAWPTPGPSASQPVTAAASTSPALPAPTGHLAVGRSVLHLVDRGRRDPWVPSSGPRQLMVSVYYPARRGTGTPAPYMTVEEARLFLQMKAPGSKIPPAFLAGFGTDARSGARPLHGRYPLVVLSPGFTLPRASLTSLAEDLTSRGYVVALVDHTYEAPGVTFPDGRTLACAWVCDHPPAGGTGVIADSRAKDVSFVISSLMGRAWPYAAMIDRGRIGMAGHSIGGNAAAVAMAADGRFRAGLNMDGTFFARMPVAGLGHRPFLMLGSLADHAVGRDSTWDEAWGRLNGWKRWLAVAGADHGTFTDLPVLDAAAGRPVPLAAQRSVAITRAYVAAFFDLALKHRHEPLLERPSRAYPEVVFQHP